MPRCRGRGAPCRACGVVRRLEGSTFHLRVPARGVGGAAVHPVRAVVRAARRERAPRQHGGAGRRCGATAPRRPQHCSRIELPARCDRGAAFAGKLRALGGALRMLIVARCAVRGSGVHVRGAVCRDRHGTPHAWRLVPTHHRRSRAPRRHTRPPRWPNRAPRRSGRWYWRSNRHR